MSGTPNATCHFCGRVVETYFPDLGNALHLFAHRLSVPGTGPERGPWCPYSGAKVQNPRATQ